MALKDEIAILLYIKNLLTDMMYLNGIIATELIKITENTAAIRRGEDFFSKSSCVSEHEELNKKIIEIVKKYKTKPEEYSDLEKHVLKHIDDQNY